MRKKQGLIDQQAAEDRAWFDRQYYQDITKRTEIQNMLRILDENQRKADTRAEAQAAITGATPEQRLASREVNRRTFADAVADIASNASALRDQYLRDYQGNRRNTWAMRLGLQDQLAGIHANSAAQWANAATNAFSSGGQMLASGLGGMQPMAKTPAIAAPEYIQQPAVTAAGQQGVTGQPAVYVPSTSVNYWNNKHQYN